MDEMQYIQRKFDRKNIPPEKFCRRRENKTKLTKLSNGDKIRAMSDEELAYFIAEPSFAPPPWCKEILCPHWYEEIVPCNECALDWLKQEAER